LFVSLGWGLIGEGFAKLKNRHVCFGKQAQNPSSKQAFLNFISTFENMVGVLRGH